MDFAPQMIEAIERESKKLRSVAVRQKMSIYMLAEQLPVARARVYLQQGVMRRVGVIERCAERVFQIFPPGRAKNLEKDELDDLTIHLHAFVMNVYGVLDNRGCKNFCVNGHLAGNCCFAWSNDDCRDETLADRAD